MLCVFLDGCLLWCRPHLSTKLGSQEVHITSESVRVHEVNIASAFPCAPGLISWTSLKVFPFLPLSD